MKLTNYAWLLALCFLPFSCFEAEEITHKSLTTSEVQAFYNEIPQSNKNGRAEVLTIVWEKGSYKEVTTGDALVFPVVPAVDQYVGLEGTDLLMPFANVSHAFAYLDNEDQIHLDLVQQIETVPSALFTGYVMAGAWGEAPNMVFQYEDGYLVKSDTAGRLELDCVTSYYYECTSVSVGNVVYGDHCDLVGQHTTCLNSDAPMELAPEDFGNVGGGDGISGDESNLCPHPDIVGVMVPCEEIVACEEGFVMDENGDCITEKDIINELKNECLKKVAEKLINTQMTNRISQAITNIFNNNGTKANLILQENYFRPKLASTEPVYVDALGNLHITIYFNPTLMYDASQEYLAAALYHEAIHAYLNYDRFSGIQLEQHYEIAQSYLDWIQEALLEAFPILPAKDANGLAVRFLADVNRDNPEYFNELVQELGFDSLLELIETTDKYRDGLKGTICP